MALKQVVASHPRQLQLWQSLGPRFASRVRAQPSVRPVVAFSRRSLLTHSLVLCASTLPVAVASPTEEATLPKAAISNQPTNPPTYVTATGRIVAGGQKTSLEPCACTCLLSSTLHPFITSTIKIAPRVKELPASVLPLPGSHTSLFFVNSGRPTRRLAKGCAVLAGSKLDQDWRKQPNNMGGGGHRAGPVRRRPGPGGLRNW